MPIRSSSRRKAERRRHLLLRLLVPVLVWLGFHGAPFIKTMIQTVQEVERGILWTAAGVAVLGSLWWWLRRRRQGLRGGGETAGNRRDHQALAESGIGLLIDPFHDESFPCCPPAAARRASIFNRWLKIRG